MNGLNSSGACFDELRDVNEENKKVWHDVVTAVGNIPQPLFHFAARNYELKPSRNPLIPVRITYSPPATICYFSDGDKIVVKCASDEKYIKEVGVQACIMKKLFGSRQKFLKLVHAGYDQPTKKDKEEITKEHIQKIIDRINQMPDEE